jgi:ATP-binding cassette, subfamily B, bacterial
MPTYTSSITSVLKRYKSIMAWLVLLAIAGNVLSLIFPRLIATAVDDYVAGSLDWTKVSFDFIGLSLVIMVLTFLQGIVQSYISEKSAKDIRADLMEKISKQTYMYTQEKTPSFLLTNITSDVDAIKMFISSAVPSIISSAFALIGASILILVTNWKLGLGVLMIIPIISIAFFFAFSKIGPLFGKIQAVIDQLNSIIQTNIVGSALVRVLGSSRDEVKKFDEVTARSRDMGIQISLVFSALIPMVMFASNLASLIILYIGGRLVISDGMSLGDFVAFNSYVSILIFPIFIIGFMSSSIARAQASYVRIKTVLDDPDTRDIKDGVKNDIDGDIELKNVTLAYGDKKVLDDISFKVKVGQKIAIIGPTAAGKSQLMAVLSGLVAPTSGEVLYNGHAIPEYNSEDFYKHIGLVFQDSVLFNLSIKENIAFGAHVSDQMMTKAIKASELGDFVGKLPRGIDTHVSERGVSLSGGQKQRIMLARALANDPKVLLLDDFTARVDAVTEKKILDNIKNQYPDVTLISVTQKISSIESYDKIVLLVEGEVINTGTHTELMDSTPEYVQIYESQKSTTHYELQS